MFQLAGFLQLKHEMRNEEMSNDKPDIKPEAGRAKIPVQRLVMCDIKESMMAVVENEPIRNAGSFALTLLWQIFEAAGDYFEMFEEVMALNDDEIEAVFNKMFPVFIAEYPNVIELDT